MTMRRSTLGRRFSATLVAWVAAAVLLVAVPGAALADTSSNIPGVPLPGAIASGQLGGPIYDVVYRLDVLPGRIILVSLTGTPGTDFDLYLFGSTATTVYGNAGLVAKSTGPTSTESLSVPSPLGGTYYLDLNGASNVEGTYRVVVQQVLDNTVPTVAMMLDGGRPATNQLTVPIQIQGTDVLSGIAAMSFSLDGTAWTNWTPFQSQTSWTFQAGDGPRTLWVRLQNGVGMASAGVHASIVIDTVAPLAVAIQPPPSGLAAGPRPTLTVRFSEPMDPASWANTGLIVQAADGSLVTGTYAYDAATFTGSFVPAIALTQGVPYVASLGAVTDLAGNAPAPLGSWVFTDVAATSMAVSASPTTVFGGAAARLTATLGGAPSPASLDVLARPAGATAFAPIGSISLTDGQGSLSVAPSSTTTYRLTYAGTSVLGPSSADVLVSVRRGIRVAAPSSAVAGRTVRVTATVSPAAAVGVSFRLYRYDPYRRTYVYAGSWGRLTSASGVAVFDWLPRSGSWYWRAVVTGTASYATNMSPVVRIAVR
ncbi:MAG TPA: Ig-like domain-containing protein [Acidothermaceae bacterium]|nr:Ig-like domain-containing protein [Acidothermaceae bacterium]